MWLQHQNSSVSTLHLSINWFLSNFKTILSDVLIITITFSQISSLAMENKILAAKLKQANQDSVVTDHCNTVRTKEIAPEQDSTAAAATTTTCAREIQVDDTQLSAAGPEVTL